MIKKISIGILSLSVGLLILLFFAYGASGIYAFAQDKLKDIKDIPKETFTLITEEPLVSLESITKKNEVELVLVGDIMLDRGVRSSIHRNYEGDYSPIFTAALSYLQNADITFGNLEGQASDKGADRGKKYSFHMEPTVLETLREVGFDVLSSANNHTYDWGIPGFEDTLTRIKANNMQYTGAGFSREEAETPAIVEANGIKVGFLGFTDVGPSWRQPTETNSGILVAEDPRFEEIITNAKQQVDHLVVSIHWGEEYKEYNSRQTELAHKAIDAGADIIAGHHPHVEQDVEEYKDGVIFYSFGNFVFDQYFSEETMQGLLVKVTLDKKGITDYELFTSKQNRDYTIKEIIPREKQVSIHEDYLLALASSPVNSICSLKDPSEEDQSFLNVGRIISAGNYKPQGLINVRSFGKTYENKNICLTKETAEAFVDMQEAAKEIGLSILPLSGYRSKEYQATLFSNWLAKFNEKPEKLAVAEPGHSEHQLGTTVDLISGTSNNTYENFGETNEYTWMKNNAYKFGFVQSYEYGKEEITGYVPETWHWRYVGVTAAKEIKDSGITITEYLSQ